MLMLAAIPAAFAYGMIAGLGRHGEPNLTRGSGEPPGSAMAPETFAATR